MACFVLGDPGLEIDDAGAQRGVGASAGAALRPPPACGSDAGWGRCRPAAEPARPPRGDARSRPAAGGRGRPHRSPPAAVSAGRLLLAPQELRVACRERASPRRGRSRRSWWRASRRSTGRARRRSACRRSPRALRAGCPSSRGRDGSSARRAAACSTGWSSMRATASRVRSPPDSTPTFLCTSSPENRKPPRMLRMAGTMSSASRRPAFRRPSASGRVGSLRPGRSTA